MLTLTELTTPVGPLTLVARKGALAALVFSEGWPAIRARFAGSGSLEVGGPAPTALVEPVVAYFGGDIQALEGIPVDVEGTDFQKRVWQELRRIRPGTVISYAELARRIGAPRAVRAVGSANGKNPVAIVIPCHRVISSDGGLGGYGGGLPRKRWLLAHERQAPLGVESDRRVADDGSVLLVDRLLVMEQLPLGS